jgi:hypothetical protein
MSDWRERQIDHRDVYPGTTHGALIAGEYRYALHRQWSPEPPMVFIMLNPSTAGSDNDDPTIRRCIGFAERENRGGIIVVNLFAYRSPSPAALAQRLKDLGPESAVGPKNHEAIKAALEASRRSTEPLVVVAWGKPHNARMSEAIRHRRGLLLEWTTARDIQLYALAVLGDLYRSPRHPLYLRSSLRPMRWG